VDGWEQVGESIPESALLMSAALIGEKWGAWACEAATLKPLLRLARPEPHGAIEGDSGAARIKTQGCSAVQVEVLGFVDLDDPGCLSTAFQH
jgi:hypothetical protein